MWQIKLKPATPVKRKKKKTDLLLIASGLLLLSACRQQSEEVPTTEHLLRIAHLTDLAWQDRNQSGQPTEFMPEERYQALLSDLISSPADTLILRGIGSEPALLNLRDDLEPQTETDWVATYISGPTIYEGIGFLTQTLPIEVTSLSSETYSIDGKTFRPLAGGILLETSTGSTVWLWNATLPDPDSPYENRRNEARLVAQAIRPLVREGQPVLLSIHCREEMDSPMVRLLTDTGLQPLEAMDEKGDHWTHRDPHGRVYLQDQLLFASPALLASLKDPPSIHSSAKLREAGNFRHQLLRLP